jgi:predicted Zn-dependent protease with MMP-like domain
VYRSKRLNRRIARDRALGIHFHLGLRAYDAGDAYGVYRHRSAVGILPEGGIDSLEFMALDWRSRWLADQRVEALAIAEALAERYPDDADGVLELGHILTDLERPADALVVLRQGAARNEDDSDLWYEVGIAAERLEDWDTRSDAFRRVWLLDHDAAPEQRLWISDGQLAEAAERMLQRLRPMAQGALSDVEISIDDYPARWVVDDDVADPRILVLFEAPEDRSEDSGEAVAGSGIGLGDCKLYLFRWNIERACGSPEEVDEQIEVAVLNEIGDFLGLDDDTLHFIGLG